MAQAPSTSPLPPVTEDEFLADRKKFFSAFGSFTTASVVFLAIVMILMAIFLT